MPVLDTEQSFPSRLVIDGTELALSYQFEPGHEADGLSVALPIVVLNQVQGSFFDWLVPGWLPEKIAALIRLLPKALPQEFDTGRALCQRVRQGVAAE